MTTKGKFMNTNRGSYLLGAALGSALVLALCAPVLAADIYDGGLKGGYDVPPPPPSDRGIYFKGYIGQANPDVGSIWTEAYDTNNFTVHHKDIKSSPLFGIGVGWQARHWLRFDLTGEYRGDAIFVGHDQYPASALALTLAPTSTRPTSRAGWVSPTPTSTWATGAASRRISAPASASPSITRRGHEGHQRSHQRRCLRRRQHAAPTSPGRSTPASATTSRRSRHRPRLSLHRPRLGAERRRSRL